MMSRFFFLACSFLLLCGASAFAPTQQGQAVIRTTTPVSVQQGASTTALSERKWNFNEGQSPWGMKKNAEIWNGRVAQMAFVIVFLQELIQGKGVVQGVQEGDPVNLAGLAAFAVTAVGLTAFLAFKGDDDYMNA